MNNQAFPSTLIEMQQMFPTEQACAAYMFELRWPNGFYCPTCHIKGDPYRFSTRPTPHMTAKPGKSQKRRRAKDDRKDESIRLRLTAEEKDAFVEAATKEGRDLSNWLRWVAGRAAGLAPS